jgi:RNA polymerase sigma-70 factor (ECF subfamily)
MAFAGVMTMPTEAEPSDEVLVSRAREGDETAFGLLFERHADALRRRVRRRLPALLKRKVAESDVIQMAYLRVHQHLDGFEDRGDGSFRAWLDRIVENQVADLLRRYVRTAKRGLGHEVSGPQPLSGDGMSGREPTPSVVAAGEELRLTIEAAMGRLPDDYRLVLRLVQGEGLTLAAAGERMGRSAGAAKQLYARAVAQLSRLVREGPGPGRG